MIQQHLETYVTEIRRFDSWVRQTRVDFWPHLLILKYTHHAPIFRPLPLHFLLPLISSLMLLLGQLSHLPVVALLSLAP